MSEIQSGDLVRVIKPMQCCGDNRNNNFIFVVENVLFGKQRCPYCNAWTYSIAAAVYHDGKHAINVKMLKRTPPLSELESHKETMEA